MCFTQATLRVLHKRLNAEQVVEGQAHSLVVWQMYSSTLTHAHSYQVQCFHTLHKSLLGLLLCCMQCLF